MINCAKYPSLKDKIVLITGGASGIGKSIAERIANEEGLVIIWDKNIDDFKIDSLVMSAAHLSIYGWKKEAIPVTQTKNSLITRIFKSLFG